LLGNEDITGNEAIQTLEAKERAQVMLTEARIRKGKEVQNEKDKDKQLIALEGVNEKIKNIDIEGDMSKLEERKQSPSSAEDSDDPTKKSRKTVRKGRVGSATKKKKL
jgi:hypothetical protein